VATGVAATVIPAGRLSVKSRFITPTPDDELLMVNVRVDTAPGPMLFGLKDLENVGWAYVELIDISTVLTSSANNL